MNAIVQRVVPRRSRLTPIRYISAIIIIPAFEYYNLLKYIHIFLLRLNRLYLKRYLQRGTIEDANGGTHIARKTGLDESIINVSLTHRLWQSTFWFAEPPPTDHHFMTIFRYNHIIAASLVSIRYKVLVARITWIRLVSLD